MEKLKLYKVYERVGVNYRFVRHVQAANKTIAKKIVFNYYWPRFRLTNLACELI